MPTRSWGDLAIVTQSLQVKICIITKISCQAWLKLLIANEVRIGGPGGGGLKADHFEALPHLILVAMAVDFEADVPCGNWVTAGFDSPLVRPSTRVGGRRE